MAAEAAVVPAEAADQAGVGSCNRTDSLIKCIRG